nr:glycosyltransferase family 2 protein [Saprospiraceae bacterium]
MKLSVLIPVYNRPVSVLLMNLESQAKRSDEKVEILCLDDGSVEFASENKQKAEDLGIPYHRQENKGRAKSRNALAELARGKYLLFLDCDSGIPTEHFLQNYLSQLNEHPIIYGGRKYPSDKPKRSNRLHWKYGRKVESSPLEDRKKRPYNTFMSNNFTVAAPLYKKYPMDEHLTKYGYEDLLWALDMKSRNQRIEQIDNPVVHEDLCTTDVFLEKTKQAMDNLAFLVKKGKIEREATPLLRTYYFLKKWKLHLPVKFLIGLSLPLILMQLKSHNPSLLLFNLWKLSQYKG